MRFLLGCGLLLSAACAFAQQGNPPPVPKATSESAQTSESNSPSQAGTPPAGKPGNLGPANGATTSQTGKQNEGGTIPASQQQPKRILGIMPNYRAVSAGAIPPPPTPKEAFKIATENSFDYSAFVFVGITSALAEWTDAHPQLRAGMAGYGRYYWRGFVDKTDGNYLVVFAFPTVFRQDERYYALGKGGIWKRGIYAASRILITPDYHGHNSFNASEVLGRAISQGVSATYYPSQDRTVGAIAVKFGYAVGRDALTNVFREFWPQIATHVLHRHP